MSVTITQSGWLRPYATQSFGQRGTTNISLLWPTTQPASRAAREPRLALAHAELDHLASLPEDWDSYGSAKPQQVAIERARQLLEDAFRSAVADTWQSPLISANEDGEVVLEWWNRERKLTIFVGSDAMTFLRSWGINIIDEMEDGDLPQTWDSTHWTWLFS